MKEKPTMPLFLLFGSLLLAAASFLPGCATTGAERAAKTTYTMQNVEDDYKQVSLQVNETNAALQDLISPNQTHPRKALQDYKNSVGRMDSLGKRLDRDSAEMRSRGESYFTEWAREGSTYTDPQIRQLSEERRTELRESFAEIPQASTGVRDSLHSYIQDLKEIQGYLSNDLTANGVEGITPVARRAMREGEDLKVSVMPVLAAIERAKTAMAQGGATRGTATGGPQPYNPNPDQLREEENYHQWGQ